LFRLKNALGNLFLPNAGTDAIFAVVGAPKNNIDIAAKIISSLALYTKSQHLTKSWLSVG
jgi:hypothetical protein